MHAVMHDWPDNKVKEILANLAPAMKKGYSKLLIYEMLLPPTGASLAQATMDVEMMALLGGLERTATAWTSLLEESGFSVIKLWPDGRGLETLIEAELS